MFVHLHVKRQADRHPTRIGQILNLRTLLLAHISLQNELTHTFFGVLIAFSTMAVGSKPCHGASTFLHPHSNEQHRVNPEVVLTRVLHGE